MAVALDPWKLHDNTVLVARTLRGSELRHETDLVYFIMHEPNSESGRYIPYQGPVEGRLMNGGYPVLVYEPGQRHTDSFYVFTVPSSFNRRIERDRVTWLLHAYRMIYIINEKALYAETLPLLLDTVTKHLRRHRRN